MIRQNQVMCHFATGHDPGIGGVIDAGHCVPPTGVGKRHPYALPEDTVTPGVVQKLSCMQGTALGAPDDATPLAGGT